MFAALLSSTNAAAEETFSSTTTITPGREKLWCDLVLDDFRQTKPGKFPVGWQTRHDHNLEEAKQKGIYVVEKEGKRQVLHARYGTHTISIVRKIRGWDLDKYPYLQWRWKALKLPRGGNESKSKTNDSVASVYVVWDAGWPFKVSWLRLAWSTTLNVGKHISRRMGHDHIVIMESGPKKAGRWQVARVDVRHLFRKYIDKKTQDPVALAITTDADDTQSTAEALYADFRLCRKAL